jgi:hypothetical protein
VTEPHDQPRADRIRRRQALVAVGLTVNLVVALVQLLGGLDDLPVGVRIVVFVVQVACLVGAICGMTLNIRDQRRGREDVDR